MHISRRAFLKYCSSAAAALGLGRTELEALAAALRNPAGPTVLWLEGLACSGCSVSFLNFLSAAPPHEPGPAAPASNRGAGPFRDPGPGRPGTLARR